jgi:Outer membrane protein beta-barrel domain
MQIPKIINTIRIARISRSLGFAALVLIFAVSLMAQEESRRWTANVGGGFSPLVGALDKRLDNGWHISFGGGYRVTTRFSIGGQVMYNGFGVSTGVLRELSVPDGNSHLWAFTAEPRFQFVSGHKVNAYVVGGVGYYRRVVQFTQPSVAAVTIFDPFFGFVPVLIPADQVLGTIVRDGIGGNAGFGLSVPIKETGAKFFTEARFHYANGGGIPTRMIPLTIGIRF